MSEPMPMPTRKAAAAFKKLEAIMKKAERAQDAFTTQLEEAKLWTRQVERANARLRAAGAASRARGRKALGVGEYAA